ncbi:unnamed protein product, partial [Phaeothamnion confervicola]
MVKVSALSLLVALACVISASAQQAPPHMAGHPNMRGLSGMNGMPPLMVNPQQQQPPPYLFTGANANADGERNLDEETLTPGPDGNPAWLGGWGWGGGYGGGFPWWGGGGWGLGGGFPWWGGGW